jgi:hypothetical protein
MRQVKLREIAYSRAGDKGDTSNVSVIPYDEAHYDLLREQLTAARVKEAYGEVVKGEVRRYELPGVKALNFVMYQALDGGVSRSLALDLHGKSRGSIMGTIDVEVPDA